MWGRYCLQTFRVAETCLVRNFDRKQCVQQNLTDPLRKMSTKASLCLMRSIQWDTLCTTIVLGHCLQFPLRKVLGSQFHQYSSDQEDMAPSNLLCQDL